MILDNRNIKIKLDNEELQRMVDYSFGDHSGVLGGVPNAYMKKANSMNEEFDSFIWNTPKETLTLFIDNIRLYRRPIEYSDWMHLKPVSPQDRVWLNQFKDEDLLLLCSQYPNKKFIIFTAFEDTPLDDYIWNKIPENVIAIHSANGVVFGGKVHPFPHGLERMMYEGYDHQEILDKSMGEQMLWKTRIEPSKILLVCHRDDTGARGSIKDMFRGKEWATIPSKLSYKPYLEAIKDHKFVLCPSGNGIESARNWETLYMKRVPIFKRHPYLEEMFKDFPVLFVDNWEEVTEEILKEKEYLYEEAQSINSDLLDLEKIYGLRSYTNI